MRIHKSPSKFRDVFASQLARGPTKHRSGSAGTGRWVPGALRPATRDFSRRAPRAGPARVTWRRGHSPSADPAGGEEREGRRGGPARRGAEGRRGARDSLRSRAARAPSLQPACRWPAAPSVPSAPSAGEPRPGLAPAPSAEGPSRPGPVDGRPLPLGPCLAHPGKLRGPAVEEVS